MGFDHQIDRAFRLKCSISVELIWQCVKTQGTPVVHIKIAGIYGCE